MTNVILTIVAVFITVGAVIAFAVAIQSIANWGDSATRGQRAKAVVLLVVAIGMAILAFGMFYVNLPGIFSHFSGGVATVETAETTPSPTPEITPTPAPTPTVTPTITPTADPTATGSAATSDGSTTKKSGGGWPNVLGLLLGLGFAIGAVVYLLKVVLRGFKTRGAASNTVRILFMALLTGAAIWLFVVNVPPVVAMVTGGGAEVAEDNKGDDGDTGEPESGDGDEDVAGLDEGKLPDGAFAVNFSEDDLLKAMKKRLGDDFSWEKYQNDFSEDLFPSMYQERKASSKAAMQKWYNDKKREGFNDPVWFAMDDLISIYHTDKWKKMPRDKKLEWIDKNVRFPAYDQILRNPRFCEMYVEFFYELAKEFPEIISRNADWLPAFKDLYSKANDPNNMTVDAKGNETVAGISVFFEPVQNPGDAKVLQKAYVMNAARICLMFDEFTPALKTVQSPRSKVRWHLAFGKNAQTIKVSALRKKEDQEKWPALIWLYRFKGRTGIKSGSNIFDQSLEIFPLTEKAKTEPPIKEPPVKKRTPNPGNDPDPGKKNNPDPGQTKQTPVPTKGPRTTPEPGKPTPKPGTPTPTATPKPKPTPTPTDKEKKPENRPSGNNVPNGAGDGDSETQDTKPNKKPYATVPPQPTKKPDPKPTQKPNAPAGNGNNSDSGVKGPDKVHTDTDKTLVDGSGGTVTDSTSDDNNLRVDKPK